MTDLFAYLKERPYPGRGILLGSLPDGQEATAYFIMGRSENSRNRIFEPTEDGIRTKAFDESKTTDPSLIIYHPIRKTNRGTIVTNGDQTDTLRDYLEIGQSFAAGLRTRQFEPDCPNWTPRISGLRALDGSYQLSILKSADPQGSSCIRNFFEYHAQAGKGRFISTYEGFGGPLPSFLGEPVEVSLPQLSAKELSFKIWDALDRDNKVSLYVSVGNDTVILNKYQ